jgi:hypothetical protein
MRRKTPRTRRWIRALPLAAIGALVLAGIAGAANSGSFTDRPGDVNLAADITKVEVSNDDAGTITIRLTFGEGGLTPGLPGEKLGVALDLDQNPDTGTVYYGTEVAFALDFGVSGTTLKFERAAGSEFMSGPAPVSLEGTLNGSTVTFTFKAADLRAGVQRWVQYRRGERKPVGGGSRPRFRRVRLPARRRHDATGSAAGHARAARPRLRLARRAREGCATRLRCPRRSWRHSRHGSCLPPRPAPADDPDLAW